MHANALTGLPGKYRPTTLTDVRGQPHVVRALASFVAGVEEDPRPAAFVFAGESGVGKTAAAWSLAFDLGCSDEIGGGVIEIPSGSQDGQAVAALLRSLSVRPMFGSGWRVAIVNEADYMTKQAEVMWLDGLEGLPPFTVVIFTTNNYAALSRRLTSRCETLHFRSSTADLKAAIADYVRDIWRKETGKTLTAVPEDLGRFDSITDQLSFRLALQQIAPFLRSGLALPERFHLTLQSAPAPAQPKRSGSEAAKKAWETRRRRQALGQSK